MLKDHEGLNINNSINKETFLKFFMDIVTEHEKYKQSMQSKDQEYDFQIPEIQENEKFDFDLEEKSLDPIT